MRYRTRSSAIAIGSLTWQGSARKNLEMDLETFLGQNR
jgi:hypothetical protein